MRSFPPPHTANDARLRAGTGLDEARFVHRMLFFKIFSNGASANRRVRVFFNRYDGIA
jgi:hypothetical protein